MPAFYVPYALFSFFFKINVILKYHHLQLKHSLPAAFRNAALVITCFYMVNQRLCRGTIIRNTERDFRGEMYSLRPSIVTEPEELTIDCREEYIVTAGFLTVFLHFIYRFRPPKMLKYDQKCQNNKTRGGVSTELFLFHGCFYFMLVCYTQCSLRPVVDKV